MCGASSLSVRPRVCGRASWAVVAAARELTTVERSVLAAFIGAQELRTPRAKDRVLTLFRAGFDRQWEDWRSRPQELANAIAQDSGTVYTPDDIIEMLGEYQYEV